MEKKQIPLWLKRTEEEVEALVLKMANQGMSAEKIGLALRDTYGTPSSTILTKKISKILKEKGIKQQPQDLANLVKNADKLKKHLEKNKKDITARRGLQLTEANISALAKYYKKRGILPSDWKY
ncbi:30S ribosomal protein S15 [Candidatus Pacearchaeota archaeon]|nr:30S ribosomal protein S15 [Candidatus Pacearchaeota archaeon]